MFVPFDRFGTIDDKTLGLSWNSKALAAAAGRRCEALQKASVGTGATVAIVHGGTAHFFADLFAVWSCGAAAACLDPALTTSERENVIAFCKPSTVLGENSHITHTAHKATPRDAQSLDDPALILFTSGTTGAPKGVVISFRALLARLSLNQYEIGTKTLARTLVTLPTHFGHGLIGNALTPLFAGGDIVLAARGLPLAQGLGSLIDQSAITFMSSVPSLWHMALRTSPAKNKTLNRVHVGSAPLSATLWLRIAEWTNCEVVNCYGITETANWIGGASTRNHTPTDGLIGKPWGGTAGVRDAAGAIRTEGTGEIVVQTPALMSGYLHRPDLTAAVLQDGWYATGDLGEVDAAGNIRLTGRAKDEINRAGFKIQPAEIDMLLESHPAIAEVCVFAVPDAVSGEIVAAAIRLAPGATEDASSLRDWCLKRLRREATPERWFFVDDIPKTGRGKVSRDAVRNALIKSP